MEKFNQVALAEAISNYTNNKWKARFLDITKKYFQTIFFSMANL